MKPRLKYLILWLGATVLNTWCLLGQTANFPSVSEPPPGPLINFRAPDSAKWTIETSHMETGSATSPPKEGSKVASTLITMTKTGKIMLREAQDPKGQLWDTWCVGGVQATIWPDGKSFILQSHPANLRMAENPFYTDYSRTDFPGFEWVSRATYTGLGSKNGQSCLCFKNKFMFYGSDIKPSDVTAYVDLKTRLPVALTINGEFRKYEFQAPPEAELVIAPIVKSSLEARQRSIILYTPKSTAP